VENTSVPFVNRVAVLITYHNEGRLLERCLASLGAQTRQVDEILVYDDASEVRPEPFVPPGLGVRVVRGDRNVGPSRARNRLLAETRCPIVHYHDADDAFAPGWCERIAGLMRSGEVDAVFTEVTCITEDGMPGREGLGLDRIGRGTDLVSFCIGGAMLPAAGTYRRDAVAAVRGYRPQLWQSEDWDFHIRLAASGPRFVAVLEPLAVIYRRPDSRSEARTEVWSSAVEAIGWLACELPEQYLPDLCEAAERAGSNLFRLGEEVEARVAFDLARRLGRPRFASRNRFYRAVARLGGAELAERASRVYRTTVPAGVRALFAHRSTSGR
jgi:glycosyltransferase involved in cell wall biosynthesis